MNYVKLKELKTFTVEKVWGFSWKMWDDKASKMMISDTYVQGYQKKYEIDTDQGKLEVSGSQLGQMLEGVLKNGVSDLNSKTFTVKTNGKTGMDVRYYINPVKKAYDEPKPVDDFKSDTSIDEIPF